MFGFEIHDSAGNLIFNVRTMFELLPGGNDEMFITTIAANFYNKEGKLVFKANSGEPDERIETIVKSAFGFAGGFGLVQSMTQDELELTKMALLTRGHIHQLLTGEIDGEELDIDGKLIMNAEIKNCIVNVKTGQFATLGKNKFLSCKFVFHGESENIRQLVMSLAQQNTQ
jgi:hypothetical protein